MSGWAPLDVDWWPAIAESLPKPWPREAILMDLRMWADAERMGRDRRPGRPALARRWGVTDYAAKEAMKAEAEWGDPSREQDPPADHQRSTRTSPAGRQSPKGQTPTTAQDPPAIHQNVASDPPEDRPTRGDPPTPTPTPTPLNSVPRARPRPDPVDLAVLRALQESDEPQHGMNQPKDVSALQRALGRGLTVEALTLLWAWSGASADTDAEACRAGGWRRWSSLLKPPLGEERVAAAQRWHEAGRPTTTRATGPPSRAAPGPSLSDALRDFARQNAVADGYDLPPEV